LGKFHRKIFNADTSSRKNEETHMTRSVQLLTLMKITYTLWGRKRLLHCVANFCKGKKY